MYEPRRGLGPIETETTSPEVPAAFGAPRYAAPSWREQVGHRVGPGLVALAVAATAGALVLGGGHGAVPVDANNAPPTIDRDTTTLSRDLDRSAATLQVRQLSSNRLTTPAKAVMAATPLTTKATLNIRAEASTEAARVGSVPAGTKVIATAEINGKYRKVTAGKVDGWVLAASLTDSDQAEDAASGITEAPCSRGSAVENKLRKDTIRIYRSVCALFPDVNSYGGWRSGGLPFHKNGRALDIMVTPGKESALGHRIAKYLIANAKAFNIDHIIFEQQIWTPSSPSWRHMADRGSVTANHFNHVHVAIRA